MDFQIDHDPIERGHLIVAAGEIDIAATPRLSTLLAMVAARPGGRLVLDLSDVTFIDSTALGTILKAAAQLDALDLARAHVEPPGGLADGDRIAIAVQAEAQLDDLALRLGQLVHDGAHSVLAQRDLDLLLGRRAAAGQQVAEGGLALLADRLLEARDRARALALGDADRHADRAPALVERAADRLPDPQRRVGGEAEPLAPVELLDGADEPEHPLLDEVEQRELADVLVLAGDRDDEPEVRVDHPLLGREVAALHALGELDLLGRREQGIAAGLVEEELQRVGRVDGEVGMRDGGRRGVDPPAVVADLDALLLQPRAQGVDVLVVELELLDGRAQLRLVDAAVLVAGMDEIVERRHMP